MRGKIIVSEFFVYVIIGLFTTFLTFVLWNIFLFLFRFFDQVDYNIRFSISQFLASFLMIPISFLLHRKQTFKHRELKTGCNRINLLKVYSIYLLSPLISSLLTFLLHYPVESSVEYLSIGLSYTLVLQVLGLGFNMFGNFFGQKMFLYK